MKWKQAALFAAAACACLPARAWDFREQDRPFTYVFLRIPLDGHTSREQLPVWGFAVRGKRPYQAFSLDSQAVSRFIDLGFVDSKIVLVGVVAGAGALLVGGAGSKSAAAEQQQQAQQAAQTAQRPAGGGAAAPGGPCVCPAPK